MNPPTIHDVARLAGVSTTTVSHIINDTRYVSDELRERVEKAIADLGYRPNSMARGLRRGESKTIGLIVPDNSNPFFAEILRVIENTGYARGYSVILCNSDGDLKKEISYTELLFAKQVDGIIFIGTQNSSEHLHQLVHNGIPIVVVDRDLSVPEADVILVDNFQGGYDATRYLLGLGHRRIACITGPSLLTPSADRVRGYQQALADSGMEPGADLLVAGNFQVDGGEEGMARLLSLKDRPTAVFACNDLMALGAMRAMRLANLSIPKDLSLIGFDDIALTSIVSPALSTVAQPVESLAQLSLDRLITRIQGRGDETAERFVLHTKLIIRETCSPIGDY